MSRFLIYGDSNSWGYPAAEPRARMADRWPIVMGRCLNGVEVIEENLPGRTTVHDDAEHLGQANNGLRFLEIVLRSHAPIDAVLILLGTNDLKARFTPSGEKIAGNLAKLVDEVRRIGGKSPVWDDTMAPKVFVLTPPPLPIRVNDPSWDRSPEWQGGYDASLTMGEAFSKMGRQKDVPVFDCAGLAESGESDPIHWTEDSHRRVGAAVADWLMGQGCQ